MTLGGFSWRGGTREYPHRQDDGREQSEEPPAEHAITVPQADSDPIVHSNLTVVRDEFFL